jgi:CSLREA domain-containing protein
MSRRVARPSSPLIPIIVATLTACQDSTSPERVLRPRPQLAQGDNGTWTVTSPADPGDGVCDDAACTLREAIAAAASGGKIVFASTIQGDVDLTAGELSIVGKSINVDGAGRIAVDGQGNGRAVAAGPSGFL